MKYVFYLMTEEHRSLYGRHMKNLEINFPRNFKVALYLFKKFRKRAIIFQYTRSFLLKYVGKYFSIS